MAEPQADPPEAGAERRFLTFHIDERRYALPAEEISEVIRVPSAARLPHSPKSLLGLANLRGSVLPIASLRLLLGHDGAEPQGSARAIVLGGAAPVALAVDAVDALVSLPASQVDTRGAAVAAEAGEQLRGVFRTADAAGVAKILDIEPMLSAAWGQPAVRRDRQARRERSAAGRALSETGTEQQLLITFEVAGQEYALPLAEVREIVAAPENFAFIPRAEAVLLGVAAHRDGLLPLLSLRGLLGLPAATGSSGREKVIVTPVRGTLVGLVADRMRAIIPADEKLLEAAPAMLAARTGGEAQVKAIFRGEGGRRLISVLAAEHLFREDVMRQLGAMSAAAPASDTDDRSEMAQFLVFRLGDEEFGLPIAAVEEVARVPDKVTRVPKTPQFLEGVINLRGAVLPIVDQRRRFDLPKFEGKDGGRLVVVRAERHRAGLIVDSVSEVLRSPVGAIEPAPNLTGETVRLVNGVINLESTGRMILLLDPAELLSRTERRLLDSFDAGSADQAGS